MTYTIIEDASPYYVRFTFDGLTELIDYCNQQDKSMTIIAEQDFTHKRYPEEISSAIIDKLPMIDMLEFNRKRVDIFHSKPGQHSSVHKDGINCKISFNLSLQILDDKCVTSWMSDEVMAEYEVRGQPYVRYAYMGQEAFADYAYNTAVRAKNIEIVNNLAKLKTLVQQPNEMVLINTDIFHAWDNSKSENVRKILTLRLKNHDLDFMAIKNIVFPQ
jgi:hypothetical protein